MNAPLTMAGDLCSSLFELHADLTQLRWPSDKYRADPVGYFRDILGVDPWEVQREVLESVRDNPRTAWKSGHRVSKSHTAGGSALWFYSSFDDARVVMSAPVARQVDGILWRQTQMMKRDAGVCVACRQAGITKKPCAHSALIDGKMGKRAATGLQSDDFREIRGYTAKDVESITGTAGKNLFFIFDETSGIPDEIFEGLEGNRAGWSEEGEGTVRVLYTGNPTRTDGEFYDAFHGKKKFFHCITTSSADTPNCKANKVVVPGLATREWCDEKAEMWGKESALYLIRVEGKFAKNEDGKIFSVDKITKAEQRWGDAAAEGRLWMGIDAAGESGTGDEAGFASRRGLKCLELLALRPKSAQQHVTQALALIDKYALPRERPVIVLDVEGAVGAKVHGKFLTHLAKYPDDRKPFDLVAVRASARAIREPYIYEYVRDELTASLELWLKEGGAIPEDVKLSAEMHVWEWREQVNGRLKLWPPKRELRKQKSTKAGTPALGRSPDRYDALALSCWEPLHLKEGTPDTATGGTTEEDDDFAEATFDPYESHEAWKAR